MKLRAGQVAKPEDPASCLASLSNTHAVFVFAARSAPPQLFGKGRLANLRLHLKCLRFLASVLGNCSFNTPSSASVRTPFPRVS